jgi:hypothetical protein
MTSIGERDERGRYLPGTSGNPHGRPPGRTPRALNALADEALAAVLDHDLRVVRDQSADPRLCKEAMDRLVRLGARRITVDPPETVDDAADQIVEVIRRHVTDRHALDAIVRDLCALSGPDEGQSRDTTVPSS